MESVTTSYRSARMLLAAWNSADSSRLRHAIDQVCATPGRSVPPSDAERIELLQGIARGIRRWMQGRDTGADLDACLELLGHLSGSRAARPLSEASLPEMPACVRQ